MSKFTPGPWIWDEPSNWMGLSARVCTEKYEPIAQVTVSGWKKRQALATARLIAAAPDLYAACVAAMEMDNDPYGCNACGARLPTEEEDKTKLVHKEECWIGKCILALAKTRER